jgi:tripartite-type tricarboxylate transporter receptor subunit TctC
MFHKPRKSIDALIAIAAGIVILAAPASAADYYERKTIDFIVGGEIGGGIDIYSRVVARHLGRHIPGNPAIIVRNMPGASSARAGYHVSMVAPKNGLTIGAMMPGAIVGPLLDDKADKSFDPSKLVYIGTADVSVGICVTMDKSKTRTFADARSRKTTMGAQAPGALSYDLAYLVKHTTGAQFEIIAGYKGSAHITLAMERGEIDGFCGWNWSSAKTQKPEWMRDNKLNFLAQIGLEENAELTQRGVAPIWRFMTSDENRKVAEVVVSQQGFSRPYLVGPGTPAELVTILRTAFDATMRDPQFVADAEKGRLDVSPLSGANVQELVQAFYATPKDIIEKARAAIRP